MDTVLLIDYTGVGCYRDTTDRAIPTLEDTDSVLDGGVFFYRSRQNAIVKCAVAARKRGFPAFAVQNGDGVQRALTHWRRLTNMARVATAQMTAKGVIMKTMFTSFKMKLTVSFFLGVYRI